MEIPKEYQNGIFNFNFQIPKIFKINISNFQIQEKKSKMDFPNFKILKKLQNGFSEFPNCKKMFDSISQTPKKCSTRFPKFHKNSKVDFPNFQIPK